MLVSANAALVISCVSSMTLHLWGSMRRSSHQGQTTESGDIVKRHGLSWDGGKKRAIAAAMMLAVLAAPGVAQADSGDTGSSGASVAAAAPVVTPSVLPEVSYRALGVSWS